MDEVTLTALKGSIRKWTQILAERLVDRGTENCALCQIFHSEGVNGVKDLKCKGCPVQARIGFSFCTGTPYGDWALVAMDRGRRGFIRRRIPPKGYPGRGASIKAAQAELDFLRSLLPPSPAPTPAD